MSTNLRGIIVGQIGLGADAGGLTFYVDGSQVGRFLYPPPPQRCILSPVSEISDRFEEPRALIAEALHNLDRFEEALAAFEETAPFELISEFEAASNCTRFRFVTKKRFPKPLEVIAKSVVHNLRVALDLTIATLVRDSGATVSKETKFPILQSRQSFEKKFSKNLLNVPDQVVQYICRLKPYDGGNQALWALAQLDNLGKHNALPPVAVAQVTTGVRAGSPVGFLSPQGTLSFHGGPPGSVPFGYEHGFLVPEGTKPVRMEGADVEILSLDAALNAFVTDISVNALITIGPSALTRNLPIIDIFEYFANVVQRIINTIERKCL
ncbi:hypothetical protein HLI18_15650 [Rhizobium laguerreae]|uniref:hypothetical protein n=1 Tax=Rhizobium TaxID=379 RepID=UPI00138A5715|nr:hypothetical protein [Rhizobium laguerreae]NDK52654.1 hypothetical protein [Rhizobium laguerreae]NNG71333.1 hypothetical protein [Rhizobium laguerreae]NNH59100.1 hypothetical protein [Rhizobium laguerreae]